MTFVTFSQSTNPWYLLGLIRREPTSQIACFLYVHQVIDIVGSEMHILVNFAWNRVCGQQTVSQRVFENPEKETDPLVVI